jgi:VanZ family protein
MPKALRAAAPFLAPLALMALIFALSAMPSDNEHHSALMLVMRKLAHFSEYFALTGLWWWALRKRVGARRALPIAVAIAVGYAITDEIHQTFVNGRTGTPRDVLIDSAGILTATWLIRRSLDPAAVRSGKGAARFSDLPEATARERRL